MNKEDFLDIVKDVRERKKRAHEECAVICKDLDDTLKEKQKEYIKDNAKFKVGDMIKFKQGKSVVFEVVIANKATDAGTIRCLTFNESLPQDTIELAKEEDVNFWLPRVAEQVMYKVGDTVTFRGKRTFKIIKIGFRFSRFTVWPRYITEEGVVLGDWPDIRLVEKVEV